MNERRAFEAGFLAGAMFIRSGGDINRGRISATSGAFRNYLDREEARDLLHDGATDDPNNHDCPIARVAPANTKPGPITDTLGDGK